MKNNDIDKHSLDLIINKCIIKLDTVLKKYPNKKYIKQLSDIKKRYDDPKLKLAVIGEFNTGKSTFINALLRKDYLSTDNIPTTVIPTYIRWDGEINTSPTIKIKFSDDDNEYDIKKNQTFIEKKLRITLNGSDDLEKIVTNNNFIGIVSHVSVSFPVDNRFEKLILIDTPGTNPGAEETKEHTNITRTLLAKEADATMILFPATTVGNRSALEFISENASHLLDEATFIITKSDTIDSQNEMKKISKYLNGLVKQRYNLNNKTIYSCSAKKALQATNQEDYSNPYLIQFNNMIGDIVTSLSLKRKQIIFDKISSLLTEMLNSLKIEQEELSIKLKNDIKVLETYSLKNLEREYQSIYDSFEKDLDAVYIERKNEIVSNISSKKSYTVLCVGIDLNHIHGIVSLRKYVKSEIKFKLADFEESVKDGINKDIKALESVYSKFSDKVYSKLKEYQLQISSQLVKETSKNSNELSSRVFVEISIDSVIGGLGIAAIILVFFNPVTLLPLLTIGWLLSDSILEGIKNNIKRKVESGLSDASTAIEKKWKSVLEEMRNKYRSSGKVLMNDYKKNYERIFLNREATDKKKRQDMEFELLKVNESLKEISLMEKALSIQMHLSSYKGIDYKLLEKALDGDIYSVQIVSDKYQQLCNSIKNEK